MVIKLSRAIFIAVDECLFLMVSLALNSEEISKHNKPKTTFLKVVFGFAKS
jgi:hypothetical protein